MKRWAAITVLLYALALVVLTVPVTAIAFGGWAGDSTHFTLGQTATIFLQWGYWLWLVVLIAGQALLLSLPLKIIGRQFIPRRALKVPCIVAAFLLANLLFAGLFSILCASFDDDGIKAFSYLIPFNLHPNHPRNLQLAAAAISTLLAFWVIGNIVFRHFGDSDDPDSLLKRIVRWLMAGSILELVIAVASHIVVRRHDDLRAPFGTFWGIATGIAILLLCFGPRECSRFVKRHQPPPPKEDPANPS